MEGNIARKQPSQQSIDVRQLKDALENQSGYPFELEIARRVEACGYYIEPNYSFEDQDTGAARELDFYALSAMAISYKSEEFVFPLILGSCKDNKNPYVFFTRSTVLSGITLQSDIPIAGCPLEVYEENGDKSELGYYFRLHKLLHVATTKVISSQFCEMVWQGNKWMVQSQTIFKDAFVPLIKALTREIQDYNERCLPTGHKESPNYQVYYPLLVLKGPMFEYYVPSKGQAELRDTKHVVIIRHYESKTVKCRYAIDAIHESYLEEYVELIEGECKKFINRIRHHKKVLVSSIKKIAELEAEKSKPRVV